MGKQGSSQRVALRGISALVLLFVFFGAGVAEALDYTFDPNAAFRLRNALDVYRQEQFNQAADSFAELKADYPWDARITIFHLMHGKSLYYAERYTESKIAFERLIDKYPRSGFIPVSHYFLGRIFFQRQEYDSSALAFQRAINLERDRIRRQVYLQNLLALADYHLAADFIYDLVDRIDDNSAAADIGLKAVERFIAERRFEDARDALNEITARFPRAVNHEKAATLGPKIEQFASQRAVVALFAPLSGEWARFGRMMSNALDLALEQFQVANTLEIERRVFDTFGNSIATALDAKKLSQQPVSAVIGPLASNEAVGLAAFADIADIPVICPTASEKGLTSITDMLFQLSPTPERMGEAIAEFVTFEFGLDSVAVLAPLDSYGKQITDGFVHTMINNGATVFYQKFYPRGTRDFRRFMLDLKEELLPDTFVAEIFINEFGDTLEVEEVPLNVPALFMPSYSSELKLLLPQLRFYKIKTLLLGSDAYGEDEIIEMREAADNPTLFVSKSMILPEDTLWLKFNYQYQKKYDEPPERVAAITYDAANMILDCVRKGLYTSDEIWRCLRETEKYEGAAGMIRFGPQRENIFVPVYFLDEGEIVRLE